MPEILSPEDSSRRQEIADQYQKSPSPIDKVFRSKCSECNSSDIKWVSSEGYVQAHSAKGNEIPYFVREYANGTGWLCLKCDGEGYMAGGGMMGGVTFDEDFDTPDDGLEDVELLTPEEKIERERSVRRNPRTPTKSNLARTPCCSGCGSGDIAWVNPNAYVQIVCGGVAPAVVVDHPRGKGWVCLNCTDGGYLLT